MAKSVTVYTASWCVWCHKLKDFLNQNKIQFIDKDVDVSENARESMAKSGQGGIPVSVIDGQVIVGFDEAKLKELLKIK